MIVAANLDRLKKVTCPKAMKSYKVFLSKLSTQATDSAGTKWEYAYTTTCIEELADKSVPARC